VRPGAAAAGLACVATAALLADHLVTLALLVAALLAVCARAPARRRRPYLVGALTSAFGVVVLSPLLWSSGEGMLLWVGPTVPVLGQLDVSTVELYEAATNGLRLAAVALAFSAYALLLDHDQLVAAARGARRSALAVALATRLLPTLERDATGMAEAVRGRGVALEGIRGYATLLSPLVSGSLERASSLAEAMEARGFGRPGGTRAPRASWRARDRVAVALGGALVLAAVVWL
jgi:energy-coupling factor transport system permease protein